MILIKRHSKNQVTLFFILEMFNCLCYFAPLSFIAIFLYDTHHLSKVEIGCVMLIGIWASRCSRILLAPIMDKIKINLLVPSLQFLGATGYLLIIAPEPYVFTAVFLISICYGNNSMLIRVLINQINSPTVLSKRFASLHVATNMAAMLGPLLFNMLTLMINMAFALKASAATLMLSGVYSYFTLSSYVIPKQKSYFKNIQLLLTNKELLRVYLLIIIAYFFYAQLFSLAPILMGNVYGLKSYIWIIGFSNSLIAVLFSLQINEFFNKKMSIDAQITTGFLLAFVGFSILIYLNNSLGLLLGVIFISLAEIAFIPGFQVILSNKTPDDQKVAIFAINALCMGVGEGAGQYFGVLTGFGEINVYSIATIYSILILGIYLSITLKRYHIHVNACDSFKPH